MPFRFPFSVVTVTATSYNLVFINGLIDSICIILGTHFIFLVVVCNDLLYAKKCISYRFISSRVSMFKPTFPNIYAQIQNSKAAAICDSLTPEMFGISMTSSLEATTILKLEDK